MNPESALTKASTDDKLIEMWLHGRPESTQGNYRAKIAEFRSFLHFKELRSITLEDVQDYQSHLQQQELKDSTRRLKINAVKSLFTFGVKLNYLQFNVAAALRQPKLSTTLAGRILTRSQVKALLAAESNPTNAALLKLAYATGARVSELCGLTWDDFQQRNGGAVQMRILGKGGKYRVVLVPASVWAEVAELRGDRPEHDPVFLIGGKPIDRMVAHRIIKAAAKRAGLGEKISFHWLRHAHCQHSLEGGAPLQLVRDSAGHSSIAVTNAYLESNPEDSSSKYLGL